MEPLQRACIQVKTDLNALSQVLSWFDQFSHPAMSQEIWLQCQLALAEGFTNAVRHAHRGKPEATPINIEVVVSDQALEMRIWDWGPGFNLEQQLAIAASVVSQEAEGGRGLQLMQNVADILCYTREADQRNCLLLVKRYVEDVG